MEQNQEQVNCFTFRPFDPKGLSSGVRLVPHRERGKDKMVLWIGDHYISADTFEPKSPNFDGNMVDSAELRQIDNKNCVFSKLSSNETRTRLVFIDLVSTPPGVKRRLDPSKIRAWVGFYTYANLVAYHSGSGRALVEFSKEGQSCLAFDFDGVIHRLVYRDGDVVIDPLLPVEMARERVRLARDQIAKHLEEGAINRVHGTAGSMHRLFGLAKDPAAKEEFIQLFLDYADQLPGAMRQDLNVLLSRQGDLRAATFGAGYGGNVVSLDSARNKGPKDPEARKRAQQKRQARIERDKEYRAKMKTASGGGGKKAAKKG